MIGSEVGWHGGKAAIRRPRVRHRGGAELELPSWMAIQKADLLSRWAFNQMLIGVATRKYARSVRLPDGILDLPQLDRIDALRGRRLRLNRVAIHASRRLRREREIHWSARFPPQIIFV